MTAKSADPADRNRTLSRRALMLAGVGAAGAAGVAGGVALEYRHDDWITGLRQRLHGAPEPTMPGSPSFGREAHRIRVAQESQTLETVKQLKAKYEGPVFGRVRVWDMVEKLALCIDPTDDALLLTSQYVHVQQILEKMEHDGVHDRDMILTALLHDLGKVMLITAEVPEHIVCFTKPVGKYPRNVGLDNVIMQFGHDEMIYSRLKDYVPEHIAWTIRYHSALPGAIEPYLSERERTNNFQLLEKFRVYDQGTKSTRHLPKVDMRKYRAMIEDLFPQPILL